MRSIVCAVVMLISASAVRAEVLDFKEATCADIMDNAAARRFYMIFLHGYLAGKTGSPTADTESMQKRNERVLKACESDRSQKLLALMEKP